MENAVVVIDNARQRGALIFAPQNLECPELYRAEVTEIAARSDEFHNMKGKYMPNRAVTDRISEAAGIDFIAAQCRVVSEIREAMPEFDLPRRTVFIGYAQGRVRLPDGSWRNSTVSEYEFDPMLRAVKEGKPAKSREALEYATFARQRASTGARLGVIRQLTGMPVTFTQVEISKPLIFSRIVQNTDYILGTKEGRMMAIAAATGMAGLLYGPQAGAPHAIASEEVESEPVYEDAETVYDDEPRNVTSEAEDLAASALNGGDGFDDEPGNNDTGDDREALVVSLEQYLASGTLNDKAAETVRTLINTKAPIEQLASYLDMLKKGRGLKTRAVS